MKMINSNQIVKWHNYQCDGLNYMEAMNVYDADCQQRTIIILMQMEVIQFKNLGGIDSPRFLTILPEVY